MNLKDKVVLITGAAKRLGREIALTLAQREAKVAIHYNNSEVDAQLLMDEIIEAGGFAACFNADLSDTDSITPLIEEVRSSLGPIQVLINNASLFYRTPFGSVKAEQWDELIRTNLQAPFFLCQAVAGEMKKVGEGCIINLGDANSHLAVSDFAPYAISKAGIETLTQILARGLAPEIRVNAILPGAILPSGEGKESFEKAMNANPMKKSGNPKNISDAVLYLIEQDFLTGVLLPVDGGRSLGR